MRLINSENFVRGPFSLGFMSPIIAVIALLWISFITVSSLRGTVLHFSAALHCHQWQHLTPADNSLTLVLPAQVIFVLPSICEHCPSLPNCLHVLSTHRGFAQNPNVQCACMLLLACTTADDVGTAGLSSAESDLELCAPCRSSDVHDTELRAG